MRYYKIPKRRPKIPKSYKNAEVAQTKFIKNQLVQKNGAVCAICGKQILNKKDLTLDHIKPKSKGGLTTLENCQLACRKCNIKKGSS